MPALDLIYWKHVAGRAYRSADLLIAVSDYVRHGLVEHLRIPNDRVVTVHNGVDQRFHKLRDFEPPQEKWETLGIRQPFMFVRWEHRPGQEFWYGLACL